jgi:recombination protein RecT
MNKELIPNITMASTLVSREARLFLLERLMPSALRNVDELERNRWLAVTASLLTDKTIQQCTVESAFRFIVNCIAYSLYPIKGTNVVHAIPFFNKKLGRQEVQFILGYKGIATLAYRSGIVDAINAEVVREGDFFQYELGASPMLIHKVNSDDDKPAVAYYAVATLRNGAKLFEVMTAAAVERHAKRYHKDFGKESSFYSNNKDAYGLKTVMLRLVRRRCPIEVMHTMLPDITAAKRVAGNVGIHHEMPLAALTEEAECIEIQEEEKNVETTESVPLDAGQAQQQEVTVLDDEPQKGKRRN